MARRMHINRLDKDELTYELTVRGIAAGTVEEMRNRLAVAKQMEKAGDSLQYPKYPFTFKQDSDDVTVKLAELTTGIANFSDTSRNGNYMKLESKLAHTLGRIENMEPADDDNRKERSVLIAQTLSLIGTLHQKGADADGGPPHAVPPSLHVIEALSTTAAQASPSPPQPLSRSSSFEVLPPPSTHPTPGTSAIKPILPHKWNLKFSGDKRGLSVMAFFERVEELRKARNVSKDVLQESGIDLFEGRAYEFYQVCKEEVSSWDQLVRMFKDEYQPAFYTEKLLEEIIKEERKERTKLLGRIWLSWRNIFKDYNARFRKMRSSPPYCEICHQCIVVSLEQLR